MGYRSEIYIKAKLSFRPQVLSILQQAKLDEWATVAEDDKYFYAYIDDIKWYEGYDHVDLVNQFIDNNFDDICLTGRGEDDMVHDRRGNYWGLNLDTYVIVEGFDSTSNKKAKDYKSKLQATSPEVFL